MQPEDSLSSSQEPAAGRYLSHINSVLSRLHFPVLTCKDLFRHHRSLSTLVPDSDRFCWRVFWVMCCIAGSINRIALWQPGRVYEIICLRWERKCHGYRVIMRAFQSPCCSVEAPLSDSFSTVVILIWCSDVCFRVLSSLRKGIVMPTELSS